MSKERPVNVASDLMPFSMVPEDMLGAVSPAAITVWCALARHANGDGVCWPSAEKLAARIKMSDRHVRRCIHEIEVFGRLKIIYRPDQTSVYKLLFCRIYGAADFQQPDKIDTTTADTGVQGKEVPPAPVSTPPAPVSTGVDAGVYQTRAIEREPLNEKKDNNVAPVGAVVPPASKTSEVKAVEPKKKNYSPATLEKMAWQSPQFAKILMICPTATGKDGYPLLTKMVEKFASRDVVEKALDNLVVKKMELGIQSLWAVVMEECKRQNDAKVIRKGGGKSAPVSESHRRGQEFYQPIVDNPEPGEKDPQ